MKYYLLFILLIVFGCVSRKDEPAIRELENYLEKAETDYSYCVIIPGAGCEGCISNSEYFAKEYSGHSDVLFIFTRIETLKLLKHKLGNQASLSKNILYDKENRFEVIEKGINNIYPVVCYIKDKRVTDWCYVSPEQKVDVIEEIKKKLDSKPANTIKLCDYLTDKENKDITLSSVVKRLEYVPLKTPKDLPVDILLSVKISDDDIFVLDRLQRLFRFDKDGNFLNLIGKKGEGPKEYLSVVNFDIDDKKGVVYMLDIYRHEIKEYSMSGNYISSIKIPNEIVDVTFKSDSCFIGYQPWYMSDDNVDRLILFDKNSDYIKTFTLNKFEKKDDIKIDLFRMAEFYNSIGKSYIKVPFDNTTYIISENNHIYKDFCIEQGDHLLPKDIAVNTELYNKNLDSQYLFELNARRIENWVYMSYFYNKEHNRVIYNLNSKSFYTISKGRDLKGIANDIDNGASFWPSWVDSGVAIGSIDIESLEGNFPSEINEKYKMFKMYDNPVLQIAYY
ncbi:6-bladed beta-propeller [uncultured Bacteroides sp.]|uniref:6-bladed beta-propeller n=1 Tax=uncultured Bacteroides sp. TaxID=162156 RepID=UPI0026311CF6|nr:6-bladed beta-propeller [uncultured Bacteroides sp.]